MKFLLIPYTGIIFVLDKKILCHRSFFYIKFATDVVVLGYEAA